MPPPTPKDLEGFWEMVLLQVDNVDSLYAELDKIRQSGWKVILHIFLILIKTLIISFFSQTTETTAGETKATARC